MNTSNIAREAVLSAGLSDKIPCHTVTQACISANQALTTAYGYISVGSMDMAVAGGVEFLSDAPLKFNRKARKLMISANKFKKPQQWLSLIPKLSPKLLIPEVNSRSNV